MPILIAQLGKKAPKEDDKAERMARISSLRNSEEDEDMGDDDSKKSAVIDLAKALGIEEDKVDVEAASEALHNYFEACSTDYEGDEEEES